MKSLVSFWGKFVLWRKNVTLFLQRRFSFAPSWTMGELLFMGSFIIINVAFLLSSMFGATGGGGMKSFAKSMGGLAAANSAFLLIPLGKRILLPSLLGFSFERGVRFHKVIGVTAIVSVLLHGLPFVPGTITGKIKSSSSFYLFTTSNIMGIISLVCGVLIRLTSLPFLRRKHYEFFYASHWIFFVLYYIFAVLHMSEVLGACFVPLFIFFLDWVIRLWRIKTVEVSRFEVISPSSPRPVLCFTVKAPKGWMTEPAQFAYIRVPEISRCQWHPFSVASPPDNSNDDDLSEVTFHIRQFGQWTEQLVNKIKAEQAIPPLKLNLDGPFGCIPFPLEQYQNIVLVGGGVGVTPILSTLLHLVREYKNGRIVLENVWFVWTEREVEYINYVLDLIERESSQVEGFSGVLKKCINCTRVPKGYDISQAQFKSGRPDIELVFDDCRDTLEGQTYNNDSSPSDGNEPLCGFGKCKRVAVMCCGPKPLQRVTFQAAVDRRSKWLKFDVQADDFEM